MLLNCSRKVVQAVFPENIKTYEKESDMSSASFFHRIIPNNRFLPVVSAEEVTYAVRLEFCHSIYR